MVSIRLVDINKSYGPAHVLKDINLQVRDKEFLVVAGPPGAGKTTLLRVIAGLETPDSGEVYFGDQLMNDVDPKDRDVAMVFESLALYPNKTGFDNIAFPLKQRKLPENEIRSQVLEVARMLRIEHLLDRMPATYSGGEAQRVALARAMVKRPKVYLLDQPLANLDALIRANMRAELKRLAKEMGTTIVYTTHDQIEALAMGDRVAVINNGVIKQCDAPPEVYDKPADKFTASFFGNPPMNFVSCTLERKGGGAFLVHEKFAIEVTKQLGPADELTPGSELLLGIRPEHVVVHPQQASNETAEATVYVVEPLGLRSIVTLQLGGREHLVKAVVPPGMKLNIGDKVYLEFQKTKIRLYDKKTEEAVVLGR